MISRTAFLFFLASFILFFALKVDSVAQAGKIGLMGKGFISNCINLPSEGLNQHEKQAILTMREEEKLAKDVYQSLYNKWHLPIFMNISRSEARHTQAVRALVLKYKLEDPIKNNKLGVYTNQHMKKLYMELVKAGHKSLLQALVVGATIEDLDIADLQKLLAHVDNRDIRCVFENLMRGSRNHMRAFISQIRARGGIYKAQYISDAELDQIISSGMEKGKGCNKK